MTDARIKTAVGPTILLQSGTYFDLLDPATHRDEWNARTFVRARVVLPLIMVGRITRDGTRGDKDTGKRASAEANILLQRYRDDDRTAGRMEWPEYLRLRYLCGFDPI